MIDFLSFCCLNILQLSALIIPFCIFDDADFNILLHCSFMSLSLQQSRHFSHVTKSGIFKNLNLRKKADRNFRSTFLKNRFRHLKLYSNPSRWLARSRCHMGKDKRKKFILKDKRLKFTFLTFQVLVRGSSPPKKT